MTRWKQKKQKRNHGVGRPPTHTDTGGAKGGVARPRRGAVAAPPPAACGVRPPSPGPAYNKRYPGLRLSAARIAARNDTARAVVAVADDSAAEIAPVSCGVSCFRCGMRLVWGVSSSIISRKLRFLRSRTPRSLEAGFAPKKVCWNQ